MRPLFFYGTLLDPEVRAAVLRGDAPEAVAPATLAGWRRVAVVGHSFPMLVRAAGGAVEGVLAQGIGKAARAVLDAWERGYRRARVTVADAGGARIEADTYVPLPGRLAPAARAWDLAQWRRAHLAGYLAATRAWRSRHG